LESINISNKSLKIEFAYIVILTLIASILPDIIIEELTGLIPYWFIFVKLGLLISIGLYCTYVKKFNNTSKYSIVLGTIIAVQIITKFIIITPLWQNIFDVNSFIGNFGGSILLKFFGIIPVIGVLIFNFKSLKEIYLSKGDLSIKADKINWLGIDEDKISWGKLSLISAILISIGTILLTTLTVTGVSQHIKIGQLIGYLPLIILFALVNSFCEGIIYRNAILGPLKKILPKNQTIIVAAVFFGIAHYYGAPSGVVGVVMSGVLGWYMCRSMYETRGFISSWIIHFMQDVVIFTTIFIMGNFH